MKSSDPCDDPCSVECILDHLEKQTIPRGVKCTNGLFEERVRWWMGSRGAYTWEQSFRREQGREWLRNLRRYEVNDNRYILKFQRDMTDNVGARIKTVGTQGWLSLLSDADHDYGYITPLPDPYEDTRDTSLLDVVIDRIETTCSSNYLWGEHYECKRQTTLAVKDHLIWKEVTLRTTRNDVEIVNVRLTEKPEEYAIGRIGDRWLVLKSRNQKFMEKLDQDPFTELPFHVTDDDKNEYEVDPKRIYFNESIRECEISWLYRPGREFNNYYCLSYKHTRLLDFHRIVGYYATAEIRDTFESVLAETLREMFFEPLAQPIHQGSNLYVWYVVPTDTSTWTGKEDAEWMKFINKKMLESKLSTCYVTKTKCCINVERGQTTLLCKETEGKTIDAIPDLLTQVQGSNGMWRITANTYAEAERVLKHTGNLTKENEVFSPQYNAYIIPDGTPVALTRTDVASYRESIRAKTAVHPDLICSQLKDEQRSGSLKQMIAKFQKTNIKDLEWWDVGSFFKTFYLIIDYLSAFTGHQISHILIDYIVGAMDLIIESDGSIDVSSAFGMLVNPKEGFIGMVDQFWADQRLETVASDVDQTFDALETVADGFVTDGALENAVESEQATDWLGNLSNTFENLTESAGEAFENLTESAGEAFESFSENAQELSQKAVVHGVGAWAKGMVDPDALKVPAIPFIKIGTSEIIQSLKVMNVFSSGQGEEMYNAIVDVFTTFAQCLLILPKFITLTNQLMLIVRRMLLKNEVAHFKIMRQYQLTHEEFINAIRSEHCVSIETSGRQANAVLDPNVLWDTLVFEKHDRSIGPYHLYSRRTHCVLHNLLNCDECTRRLSEQRVMLLLHQLTICPYTLPSKN